MFARTTSLAAATFRRAISAVMCALILLSLAVSTDAGASTAPAPVGQTEFVRSSEDTRDASVVPDALPCHSAHHLCGKVTPLAPTVVAGIPDARRPEFKPVWRPARVLLSGVTALPPKPPRA